MVLKPEKRVRNAAEVIKLLVDAGFTVVETESRSKTFKAKESSEGFSALIGKRNRPLVVRS